MKKNYALCILVFLFFSLALKAQLPYIKPCYGISAGSDSSFCSTTCKNISRVAVPQYDNRATNTYQVLTMSLPAPMYNNTGTNVIVNQDDVWSGVVNMGFNFCFFGNTYNRFVIGANGLISFNTAYAGAYCSWSYTGGIPDAAKPINSIMGVYTDIDPSVGFNANRINWYIEGSAPCRRAVINFYRVPMFSSSCNNQLLTSQIVLHEAYNIIDVIVVNKPVCSSWNGGRGIIGIQNINGTSAFAPAGQNPSTSNLTNTCYRFLPNGALLQSINWTEGATVVSNTATLPANLCPGTTRTFTANLVNNRCDGTTVTVSDDVTFTVNNGGANAGADQSLSCIAPNITIGTPSQANTTYAWSPAAGLSNAAIAQPTTNTPNTYIVTATNTLTGCTGKDTVIVSPLTNPVANAGADSIITCARPSVLIGTSAIAGHTYSWSPATGLSNPNIAQPTASAANTYTLTITNTASGCNGTDAVSVTLDNTAPTANAGTDKTLTCTNSSYQIGTAAIAGNTYTWSPTIGLDNANIAQPIASAPGTYTLTVTKTSNGCIATDAITITQNITAPNANAGADKLLTCTNTSYLIGTVAIGGNTYSWSPSAGLSNNAIAQPTVSSPGLYTLTVTNTANGCTSSDDVDITKDISTPIADAGANVTLTCTNPTLQIGTATIAGNSYSWSPSVGLSNANIAQPTTSKTGNYTLTVTQNSNGCTSSDAVNVTIDSVRPAANAGINKVITCTNTTHLIGSTAIAGNTYSWSPALGLNSDTIAQPTASTTGTYNLTVTNIANGCTNTDATIISVDTTRPAANAGADKIITCSNPTHVIGTAAVAGNTYAWTPSIGLSNAAIAQPITNTTDTYTLTVTKTSNGCSSTDAVIVAIDTTRPIANAGINKIITCTNPTHVIGTAATAGNSYAWTPSVGLSNAAIAQPTANKPGNYVLTVTKNANGCTSSDAVLVTVDTTQPNADAGSDVILTCINPTLQIGSVAVAGNTYAWSPALGLSNASIAQPTVNANGNYTLTVTKLVNGCTSSDAVTVSVDTTKPVANAGANVTLTCSNPTLQIGTVAITGNTYVWSPSVGLSNAAIAQPIANTTDTYTLTVTKTSNGCTSTDAVIVAIDTTRPITNAGVDKIITCTNPTQVIGTAATAGNSYAWTPSIGLSNATIAQPTANTAANYILTVTKNANGCTSSDAVLVTADTTRPGANAGSDVTLTCINSTLQIGSVAVAGNTYAWSPALGLSNASIAQPAANSNGIYTLTVTKLVNGCTSTDAVTVAVDTTKPTANAGADKIITCTNPTLQIGTAAITGNTYAWSPSLGLSNAGIAQPIANTTDTYTLTVTKTSNGCSSTDAVTVAVDTTRPNANAGIDKIITCTNPTQVIGTAATTGNSYAWTPSVGLSNTAIAQPTTNKTGNYVLTVTKNANGCTSSDAVLVTADTTRPGANAGVDKTITCSNPTHVIGTNAVAGVSYSWSPEIGLDNAAIAQPTVNANGIYTLTVTKLVNGCTSTDAVMVAVDTTKPTANAGVDKIITCTNPTHMIGTAAITGNTYTWLPTIGLSNATIAQPTANTKGNYTVTVTNLLNGCSTSDVVVISVDTTKSVADAGSNKTLTCATRTQTIGSLAIPGNTYSWSPSIGLNNASVAQPSAIEPNTYTVTVTNLSNGCTSNDAVIVLQNINAPAANIGIDKIITCTNPTQQIGAPAQNGFSYSWSPAIGLNNPNIAQPTVSSAGTYTLTVTLLSNGCTSTDGVTVSVDTTRPLVNAGADVRLTCTKPTSLIGTSAISGNTYSWSPATGLDNAYIAQPNANTFGTYTVTVTKSINGCSKSDAVLVARDTSFPVANAGMDQVLTCTKTLAYIGAGAVNGYAYSWSPSTGLSNTSTWQPRADSTGTFTLTVTKISNGCQSSDDVTISRDTVRPIADAGIDQTFDCPHLPLVLGTPAMSGMSYTWTQVNGISAIDIAQPTSDTAGTYVLKVKNDFNGCVSKPDTVVTLWKNCECEFLIPTAFSPNNDGLNDDLKPLRFCDDYSDLEFSVFNRWGELLFKTNDILQGWDGLLRNNDQQVDSYIWTLSYYDILHKQKIFKKGTTTLLK